MKIPKKILVGGHIFSVEFTKPKDTERQRGNWGKTLIEEKRILLDKELPKSQLEETFLHEIIHICFHHAKLNYDFDDEVKLTEEQVVSRMSEALYEIFSRNKLNN